jgi:hypothetical protein
MLNLILLLLILLCIPIIFFVCRILLSIMSILFTFPPSIRSEPKLINCLIKSMQEIDIKQGVFYDLGSGDGQICYEIARTFPKLEVKGVEKFALIFWISKVRSIFWKQKNIKLIHDSFVNIQLSNANFVFLFLTKSVLVNLLPKLTNELKKGTFIFSNNFTIDGLSIYKKVPYRDMFTTRHLFIYKI